MEAVDLQHPRIPMLLSPATRLGPYEIVSSIGSGGMGEVYCASDTRLDRIVAIKVLPEHLSDNSQLRERFEREAKAISSLSHPHICPLYDVGHQDGVDSGYGVSGRRDAGPPAQERAVAAGPGVTARTHSIPRTATA